jgi:predicted negative regulator of RcsB-dependent stress response
MGEGSLTGPSLMSEGSLMLDWLKSAWQWLVVGAALVLGVVVSFAVTFWRGRVTGTEQTTTAHEQALVRAVDAAQQQQAETRTEVQNEIRDIDGLSGVAKRDAARDWIRASRKEHP